MAKMFQGEETSAYPENRDQLERELTKILKNTPRRESVAAIKRYLEIMLKNKTSLLKQRRRRIRIVKAGVGASDNSPAKSPNRNAVRASSRRRSTQ